VRPARLLLALAAVVAVVAGVAPSGPEATAGAGAPSVAVIVSQVGGDGSAARAAVERAGGVVTGSLDIVDGFSATVPAERLAALTGSPGVGRVSVDRSVDVQGVLDGGGTARSVYREATGAAALASGGLSGRGVAVALIDTGVADLPDLAGRVRPVTDPVTGQTSPCVDLSGEGHCRDSYGHGTFMAGIIAGNGSASGGRYAGMAPGADVISLKVAGADGSSDVSKVLAAIQWVVQHREHHGIRVLNLSLGTDSRQSWQVDPFNYAVERAWDAGIVVIVAASNRGPTAGSIAKPGDDPWVVTVGAVDDRGTPAAADDRLPDFSSRGPTADGLAKPDVVAPGARLVSLDAPGSAVSEHVPSSMDRPYRRGTGTSMAAAAVSGGVALLLEHHPGWTPDDVKAALRSTARSTASEDPHAVGAGGVDLAAAAGANSAGPVAGRGHSSGLGSLDASRGSVRVRTDGLFGTVLDGSLTAQMLLWDPVGFTTGDWGAPTIGAPTTVLHRWHGTTWYGNNWHGNNWHGNNWHGDWEGATSSDGSRSADRYGEAWLGAAWLGLWE
jgi:serine protease AprX